MRDYSTYTVFIKIDSNGNIIWSNEIKYKNSDEVPSGVGIDSKNNIYLYGIDMKNYTRSNDGFNYYAECFEMFLIKYNQNGEEILSRKFGTDETEWSKGIIIHKFDWILIKNLGKFIYVWIKYQNINHYK